MENTERDDDLDLTDGERAELEAEQAEDQGAQPSDPPAPTPEPPATNEPDPVQAAREAADRAEAAAAAAAEAAARNQPPPAPAPEPEPEPDWKAERRALRDMLDKGELDEDGYEERLESLSDRKAEWIAQQAVAKQRAEDQRQLQEQAEAAQDQQWRAAVRKIVDDDTFVSKALENPIRKDLFGRTIESLAATGRYQTYEALLQDAVDKTLEAFNIQRPAAADPKKAVAAAVAKRATGATPPNLERAPAAPPTPDRGSRFENLDALDIDELENVVARMNGDELDAYLSEAPGGLRDNPRATT